MEDAENGDAEMEIQKRGEVFIFIFLLWEREGEVAEMEMISFVFCI